MERMAGHFRELLESVVREPEKSVWQLGLMAAGERAQVVAEWNQTAGRAYVGECLPELFEEEAGRRPEAVALICGAEQVSYGELNERANRLGHYLQSVGVGGEVKVGICLERTVELVVAVLGVLKAGGAYVPLDPGYPEERLSYMLGESGAAVLLTESGLRGRLRVGAGVKVICLERGGEQFANQSGENPGRMIDPENLAYVIYTSGSTGRPKGVAVTHRGLSNLAYAQTQQFHVQTSDRVLQFASLSFDASIFEIAMAFRAGATLCVPTQQSLRVGTALLDLLREERITNATLPPSAVMSMPVTDLTQLRTLIVAGEACSAELVKRWGSNRELFNAYGPTETTVWATTARCEVGNGNPSIGAPISNARIYILDRCRNPVPIGVTGEIYIGGIGVARGYLNQSELTAERFIPDPFTGEAGSRMYCSGDTGKFRTDGSIEFLGRIDEQVKVRGFRIELGEVEGLLKEHSAVKDCAVVLREDLNGASRLIAYIACLAEEALRGNDLRAYLKARLPDYAVPSAIIFLDEIPLTGNGKIDRCALPPPDQFLTETEEEYVAPVTAVEELLCGIWTEVLEVAQVGTRDNFFARGGHSLLATLVLARVQEVFGTEIPLRTIFEFPTVAEFAEVLVQELLKTSGVEEILNDLETQGLSPTFSISAS
jgi:amino acid adenylation domain-containing protein